MLTPLIGHTSKETAFVQDDYPLGGNYRGKRRVWIETSSRKGTGQRFVYQTVDPRHLNKTGQERWCKEHCGTYSAIIVLTLNSENNHVELEHLSAFDSLEKIEKFAADWAPALQGEYESKVIKALIALRKAEKIRAERQQHTTLPEVPIQIGEVVRIV